MREKADGIGSETVTTPVGTFQCEHWRMIVGSSDVWISDRVGPRGLVKMVGKDSNLTLTRLITDAKTHITGAPHKFDPMEMMRQRGKS